MRISLTNFLQERSYSLKFAVLVFVDFGIACFSLLFAYALRLSSLRLPPDRFFPILVVASLLAVLSAFLFGIYRHVSRTFSAYDERQLFLSQLSVAIIVFLGVLAFDETGFPRSLPIINFMLSVASMVGVRRVAFSFLTKNSAHIPRKHRSQVAIYGADATGLSLLLSLEARGRVNPVLFLDSDESLVKRRVNGRRVHLLYALPKLLTRYEIEEVYIAKRGISYVERQKVVEFLETHKVGIRIVPGLDEIATGDVSIRETRVISVDDLLGRDAVPPQESLINKAIRGKTVLVTGAGGSIGFELVRQVIKYAPEKLILLDHHEHALFVVQKKIEPIANERQIVLECVLGSICDEGLIRHVFSANDIDTVYHAAAYKHVNLVQTNIVAGIVNNIEGTRVLATAAKEAGVRLFGLISTDKAVRPTGAMGATKRAAEMIVQNLAVGCTTTTFTMVRFGNVLGSSGSVVPIFEQQIEAGGPVTVTHPDVIRYFMLISEAAQLVIQASAMAEGGEVFVLDMGEPVKIADLARMMVGLAGRTVRDELTPDGDIEIKFTGLGPGEKLYEELLIGGDIVSTEHTRIFRSQEEFAKSEALDLQLASLMEAAVSRDLERCMRELMALAAPALSPKPSDPLNGALATEALPPPLPLLSDIKGLAARPERNASKRVVEAG